MLFKKKREKRMNQLIDAVYKKNIFKRGLMLILGCLIVAIAFNLFFLQYNIVCFGVSGISIVFNEFGIEPSVFIIVANIILIIIAYFFLGVDNVKNQIVGAMIYPVFVSLTEGLVNVIKFDNLEMVVIAVMGGLMAGLGYGLIYKSGYSTGGTDVMGQLICKYSKTSMGNAMMFVNFGIIILGKLVFSWEIMMYSLVVAYLIGVVTDKILLGISNSKAFYIVVDKKLDDKVNDFLVSLPGVGSTIIDASGGYSNDNQTLILAVAPTKMYFVIKEGLKEIDKSIFYLVCDSYEVSNKGDK